MIIMLIELFLFHKWREEELKIFKMVIYSLYKRIYIKVKAIKSPK